MRTALCLALLLVTLPASAQSPAAPTAPDVQAFAPLDADALAAALDDLLDTHPTAQRTTVTLAVRDLDTGETLYNRGGNKLLTPASNLKIYTAAAAIDLLGPRYRWTTELKTDAAADALRTGSGVLGGHLILVSGGDPMFNTDDLRALLKAAVDQHGIRQINGQVVATPPLTADRREEDKAVVASGWDKLPSHGPGWMWDDEPYYFNMAVNEWMLDFNVVQVRAETADVFEPVHVELTPEAAYPPVGQASMTLPADAAGSMDRGLSIYRRPYESLVSVDGFLSADADPVEARVTVDRPGRWVSHVAAAMLNDQGVKHKGPMLVFRDFSAPLSVLATRSSKPLSDAVQHFLRVSENAVGEMLLLHLAEKFAKNEDETPADVSWPAGAKVITDWLVHTAGLEEGSFRLVDGSGLSRYSLISADSSIELLDFMDDHEHFDVFHEGLPTYKVELPEAGGWNGVPLAEFDAERVAAKPGGMSGVSTISGYLTTLDGRRLAFSLLANGYLGSNRPVRDLRGRVWATLVRYSAETP